MCHMKRTGILRAAIVALLACALIPAYGAKGKKQQDDDDVEKVSSKGRINWTQGALYATGLGAVMQGYTEASNVDPVTEISALIVAQRAYEMNSKVVTTADQMLSTTNTMKQ